MTGAASPCPHAPEREAEPRREARADLIAGLLVLASAAVELGTATTTGSIAHG